MLIFFSKSSQKIHGNFEKWLIFLIFHYRFWQISWNIFYLRGLSPPNPHYSLLIFIHVIFNSLFIMNSLFFILIPYYVLFILILHFSRIFPLIFQISINFNAIFWKINPNFRALPNRKISCHRRKIRPTKHFVDPLNRKILPKLLSERNREYQKKISKF